MKPKTDPPGFHRELTVGEVAARSGVAVSVAVASVGSGVGLVAAAGLHDGKRATTHWGLASISVMRMSRRMVGEGSDGWLSV